MIYVDVRRINKKDALGQSRQKEKYDGKLRLSVIAVKKLMY